MAKKQSCNGEPCKQINILAPESYKTKLQHIARIKSLEQNKDIYYTDLIREEIEKLIAASGSFDYSNING